MPVMPEVEPVDCHTAHINNEDETPTPYDEAVKAAETAYQDALDAAGYAYVDALVAAEEIYDEAYNASKNADGEFNGEAYDLAVHNLEQAIFAASQAYDEAVEAAELAYQEALDAAALLEGAPHPDDDELDCPDDEDDPEEIDPDDDLDDEDEEDNDFDGDGDDEDEEDGDDNDDDDDVIDDDDDDDDDDDVIDDDDDVIDDDDDVIDDDDDVIDDDDDDDDVIDDDDDDDDDVIDDDDDDDDDDVIDDDDDDDDDDENVVPGDGTDDDEENPLDDDEENEEEDADLGNHDCPNSNDTDHDENENLGAALVNSNSSDEWNWADVEAHLAVSNPLVYKWFKDRKAQLKLIRANQFQRAFTTARYDGVVEGGVPILSIASGYNSKEAAEVIVAMTKATLLCLDDEIWEDYNNWVLDNVFEGNLSPTVYEQIQRSDLSGIGASGARFALSWYTGVSTGAALAEVFLNITSGELTALEALRVISLVGHKGKIGNNPITVVQSNAVRRMTTSDLFDYSLSKLKSGTPLGRTELLLLKQGIEKLSDGKVTIVTNPRLLHARKARGAFDRPRIENGFKGAIILGNYPTYYLFAHEFFHFKHWLQNAKVYAGYDVWYKEFFVFQKLWQPHIWQNLTRAERVDAIDSMVYSFSAKD